MNPDNILKFVVNRKRFNDYYWFLCDLNLPCIPPVVFASNLKIINAVYIYLPEAKAWSKHINNLSPIVRPQPKRSIFPQWQRGEEVKIGRLTDLKWKLTYNALVDYSQELSMIESYQEAFPAEDDTAWLA